MDSINNVCRVCLSANNLKWVFDRKVYCVQNMNLKNVILTITGVEILTEDTISQKICTKCYRTSIKMYQFRMRARKNNKILMDRYNGMLNTSLIEHEIPNIGVTIEKKGDSEMEIKEVSVPNHKMHPSVRDVLKHFPRLKLPSPWLTSNIEPCVILKMDALENFLNEKVKNKQISASLSKSDHIITRENTSSLPIMKTDTDSVDGSFNKKISIGSKIVSDNSNNGDSDYELGVIDNSTIEPDIRSHTDCEFSSDATIEDSSGPFPRESPMDESAERSCLEKPIPLLVCSICNSVHDNVKKLERHQLRHLRCQFCRSMFKTIRSMESHLRSSCAIKNMMNHLPSVELERIDLNQIIRTKYPEAFIDYPRLQLSRSANDTSEHEATGKDEKAVGCNLRYDDDVTEILSDDDTTLSPGNDLSNTQLRIKEIVPVRNITQSKINNFFLPTISKNTEKLSSTVPAVMSISSSIISTTFPVNPTATSVISASSSIISGHLSSADMVEPDIRIENSTVIDRIIPGLSDIESVKKILTDSTALKKEGFSQTELSCSTSICVDETGGTIELKNMKNLLVLYRIPFLFKKGNFQARYDYNSINSKPQQPNKLCMWNDLVPVDIQVVSNNEGLVQDKIPEITSEVVPESYSTPGITDNCTETPIDPFNSSLSTGTSLRTYSRKNRFSPPVNTSSVRSNSGIVGGDLVRTNTAAQQSNTDTAYSSTASYVQRYHEGTNITYLQSNCIIAKDPTFVQPEANIACMQTTPIFYPILMRGPSNISPFGISDSAVPTMGPLVSYISMSNVSDTDSARSNPQNSLLVRNEIPDLGPNLVSTITASSSNTAAFGTIRVKSLRDLT